MKFSKWPYWVKGVAISLFLLIFLAVLMAVILSASSLCGFNSAGQDHICTLSDRMSMFFGVLFFVFVFPFVNILHNIYEYRNFQTIIQISDGVFFIPVIIGVLLVGAFLGRLYGKIKNRKQPDALR